MNEKVVCSVEESEGLGAKVAQKMIDAGALELLQNAQSVAFKDKMPQRI